MPATVLQFRSAEWEESSICCECGVEFASPVLRMRHVDGEIFYCPNGHAQHYTQTTEQKLREELEFEIRERRRAENDAEWERGRAKEAKIAEGKAKAALKRIETRVHAGLCICCNRTFQNLARHMATKHPDGGA